MVAMRQSLLGRHQTANSLSRLRVRRVHVIWPLTVRDVSCVCRLVLTMCCAHRLICRPLCSPLCHTKRVIAVPSVTFALRCAQRELYVCWIWLKRALRVWVTRCGDEEIVWSSLTRWSAATASVTAHRVPLQWNISMQIILVLAVSLL